MEPTADDASQQMVLQYRDAPGFEETAKRNRALITDALDDMEAGDMDALSRIFDPDVTFHEASCLPYGGTLPVCELFRFRDGKVIEWRANYFDACLVAEALRA